MKTRKPGTKARRKVQFPPLCHDALFTSCNVQRLIPPPPPRGAAGAPARPPVKGCAAPARRTPVIHWDCRGARRTPVIHSNCRGARRTPVIHWDYRGARRTPVIHWDCRGARRPPVIHWNCRGARRTPVGPVSESGHPLSRFTRPIEAAILWKFQLKFREISSAGLENLRPSMAPL